MPKASKREEFSLLDSTAIYIGAAAPNTYIAWDSQA